MIVLAPAKPWMLLVLLLIPFMLMPSWLMLKGKKRKSLIPVLKQTGLINLGFSVLFSRGHGAEPRVLARPGGQVPGVARVAESRVSQESLGRLSVRTMMSGLASTRRSSASASATSPALRSGLALPEKRWWSVAVAASRCFWKKRKLMAKDIIPAHRTASSHPSCR